MADEQQLQKVVVASKSMAVAVILAILFGSLGLMPASVVGGIVMLVLSILVGIFADDHAHQSKDTLVQEGVDEGSANSTDISIVGTLLGGFGAAGGTGWSNHNKCKVVAAALTNGRAQ